MRRFIFAALVSVAGCWAASQHVVDETTGVEATGASANGYLGGYSASNIHVRNLAAERCQVWQQAYDTSYQGCINSRRQERGEDLRTANPHFSTDDPYCDDRATIQTTRRRGINPCSMGVYGAVGSYSPRFAPPGTWKR